VEQVRVTQTKYEVGGRSKGYQVKQVKQVRDTWNSEVRSTYLEGEAMLLDNELP
jgi:hypothetical protein